MRTRSAWLSHPKFKATWVALAAGSLAGLAVLGACSDSTVSQVAGLRAPDAPKFGVVGALSHTVQVCVDVTSDPGPGGAPFTFVGAAMDEFSPPFPWFERMMTQPEIDAEFDYVNGFLGYTSNSYGPFNAATNNDVVTTNPSTTPGNCANVFVRANTCEPAATTCAPNENVGNRMWNTGSNVINKPATVSIVANVPAGYTFTLSCTNDDPGNPQSCVDGGYSSANVFHGSNFTYKFTAPTVTPCPAGTFTFEIADGVGEANWPAGGNGDLLIRYDQFPAPNDNSYGVNAVGWPGGHTFGNLTGSDKAGVQIKNTSGTVILSFNMDYLTSTTRTAATPSGYASLGPNGGDGGMLVGTNTGISVTTSLANNLNKTGYCTLAATNFCTVAGTNLLVDSPPTDAAHQTYAFANAAAHGLWDFHNTYYARISAAKVATFGAGWTASSSTVQPNLTVLHNSPDKPCPIPCSDLVVGAKSFNNKEVRVVVDNINEDGDAYITTVNLTWPQATNGNLVAIKVGGSTAWTGSIGGGTATIPLTSAFGNRDISKHSDEQIKFIFANNASTNLASYTGSLAFGENCVKTVLP